MTRSGFGESLVRSTFRHLAATRDPFWQEALVIFESSPYCDMRWWPLIVGDDRELLNPDKLVHYWWESTMQEQRIEQLVLTCLDAVTGAYEKAFWIETI